MRLDVYVSNMFSFSRHKAQEMIGSGGVFVNGKKITKKSYVLKGDECIEWKGNIREYEWVSRGGRKLYEFLCFYNIDVSQKDCLDVGASTGGFTQVLHVLGARSVYSIEKGTNQVHDSLKTIPSIVVFENTDIRTFTCERYFDMITVDVSWISLKDVFSSIHAFSSKGTQYILLWKPQFELPASLLTKRGIPKKTCKVEKFLGDFLQFVSSFHIRVHAVKKACILGEAGVQEYFVWGSQL